MANCIGCRYYVPIRPHKGHGECWQQPITKTGIEKPTKDAIKDSCGKWRLLEQGQVKGRSKRKFIWDANQTVRLE